MRSVESAPNTSFSGIWMVTGTTFSPSPISIITASEASRPASAARNSVWPGKPKPALAKVALLIGFVTTALAAPLRTKATDLSIDCWTIAALAEFGRPAVTGDATWSGSTGRASANTDNAAANVGDRLYPHAQVPRR